METKIDFVVTWVDGEDENWLAEKRKYVPVPTNKDTDSKNRYRDMKTFKYWFRAVEKYAPWVNKIYFVTWGHVPEWMNTNNEKLVVVNHKDFIPNENLPVFNCNSIETFIHRIKGLSETFVYFNDDMFIAKPVKPTQFFKNGIPRDSLVFDTMSLNKADRTMRHIISNDIELIEEVFDKRKVVKENFWKIYNLKYGKELFRTICLTPWKGITGIANPHMGISFLKSTFNEVWDRFGDILNVTTKNRIRTENDISDWVFRYWQLMQGKFIPNRISEDRYFSNFNDTKDICKAIKGKKFRMICINDANIDGDFDKFTSDIVQAFESVLPEKSSFEK